MDPAPNQDAGAAAGRPGTGRATFCALLGVIWPGTTLAIEWRTHMCAEVFFDPIPGVMEAALVALVVAANAARIWLPAGRWRFAPAALDWLNGIALGVAAYYTLLFLPMLPLAIVAIILYGMGLLPLAPLAALLATFTLRRSAAVRGSLWGGAVLGVALLLAPQIPAVMTQRVIVDASSKDPARAAAAVRRLRAWGSEDELYRRCWVRFSGWNRPLVALAAPPDNMTTAQARDLWFRVTGTPYARLDRRPPRAGRELWDSDDDPGRSQDWDAERDVALPGVSLSTSALAGSVDADAALAYLEWTLVVANAGRRPAEGRAVVQLPRGAVVSRLTLWVKGEEREASFAGREAAASAYERVVRAQRDPILVRTAGADRIALSFFPVPPGGDMKFRIGITAPLQVAVPAEARLTLPALAWANFHVTDGPIHDVLLESKRALSAGGLSAASGSGEGGRLAGRLCGHELARPVAAARDPSVIRAWTPDPEASETSAWLWTLDPSPPRPPRRVAVVVDGSASAAAERDRVAGAIERLPDGVTFSVRFAGDIAETLAFPVSATESTRREAAARVRAQAFEGGRDNLGPLLEAGDELAALPGGGLLIWICGEQPWLLGDPRSLARALRTNPAVQLRVVQVRSGPNRVAASLDGLDWSSVRIETPATAADLALVSPEPAPGTLERVASADPRLAGAHRTSDHLARLGVRQAVSRRLAGSGPEVAEAREAALRHKLVTPLTAAVVLETDTQYRDAGIPAGNNDRVPSVPEPATVALVVAGAVVLVASRRRRLRGGA